MLSAVFFSQYFFGKEGAVFVVLSSMFDDWLDLEVRAFKI